MTDISTPFIDKLEKLVAWQIENQNQPDGWNISIIFVDDKHIARLNSLHLDKNQPTDVLSFNLSDELLNDWDGEIYISLETAQKQAQEYSVNFENEVSRLVAHGVFHLFGYEDETVEKQQIMTLLENKAIETFF